MGSDADFLGSDMPTDEPSRIATEICGMDEIRKRVRDADELCAVHGAIQIAVEAALAAERKAREKAERERERLRNVVSKCAIALGNGAFISPSCTVEFMEILPSEIGLHVASLVEDRDTWKERADAAEARHAALAVAARKAVEHIKSAHASLLGLPGAQLACSELQTVAASLRREIGE